MTEFSVEKRISSWIIELEIFPAGKTFSMIIQLDVDEYPVGTLSVRGWNSAILQHDIHRLGVEL